MIWLGCGLPKLEDRNSTHPFRTQVKATCEAVRVLTIVGCTQIYGRGERIGHVVSFVGVLAVLD
jgi:hypothetical protein